MARTKAIPLQGPRHLPHNRRRAGWLLCLTLACLLWFSGCPGRSVQAQTEEEVLLEYTVQEGDTLLGIAAQFAVSVQILQALNGLEDDANLIVLGQTLLIPRVDPPESSCAIWYEVEPGDSLWGIAASYGLTVEALARSNGIDNQNFIAAGQRLCVEGTGPESAGLASLPTAPPEFPWVIHATESFWYTVNLGDTLAWIALRYNKAEEQLREANALTLDSEVVPGQILWIPGTETVADGPTAQQPWTARYYPVSDLTGEPALVRYEASITHNWFNGAPDPELPADSFSAQWEGEFDFAEAVYRFVGIADHGVRVYLDDQLILDNWSPGDELTPYVDIEVGEGVHTIRVDYREQTGAALIYVTWFLASSTDGG